MTKEDTMDEMRVNRLNARGVFFQAEDGIRDHCVPGVQTCALPIFDHRVAALGDLLAYVGGGGLGEGRLHRARHRVAALRQQALELVEEDVAAWLADVQQGDRLSVEIGRASCRERAYTSGGWIYLR